MSANDQLVEMMENYIAENKKFSEKKVKAAATRARAALQEIGKAVKEPPPFASLNLADLSNNLLCK